MNPGCIPLLEEEIGRFDRPRIRFPGVPDEGEIQVLLIGLDQVPAFFHGLERVR